MATIREKGPAQWHVQVRRKGWPTKSKTLRTKKEAEIWARDVENSMDRGIFVDRTPSEKETLKQVLERYMLEVTDKRPGQASRDAERARFERFIRDEPDLCAHAMAHLQPEHFMEYRDRRLTETAQRGKPGGRGQYKVVEFTPKLRKDGTARANAAKPKAPPKPPSTIKPGTVKKELMHLKSAIDHSRRRLGLVVNPVNATDVKRPTVNDERDVRLEPHEIERLLEECRAARNPWLAPIVESAFEIGARRGSLLRIEWRDIDLKQRTITLRAVKNSRSPDKILNVAVGLSPRAIEILEALPRTEDEPKVFPITENALDGAFDRARTRAGVEHFNFHDTRHELASRLIEAGWSDSEVMAQTGHRDPKSLRRYINLRKAHLADKLAALPPRDTRPEVAKDEAA
ncbi:site-specific integrase [Bosea sp. NPDC055594]